MRRILATESHYSGMGQVLSLEEEQIVTDEANQDLVEVESDLADGERAAEVVAGLENIEMIASDITEATPVDIALINTAADMATAGTGIDGEEILPAMESFTGGRISLEGISDSGRRIWASIQEILKRIWEKIEGFYYKLFGTIPSIRKRLDALEARIDSVRSLNMETKKFTQSSGLASISVDYSPIKDESGLLKAVDELTKTAEFIYKDGVETFAKVGKDVADVISDFSIEKKEELVKKTASILATMGGRLTKLPGSSSIGDQGGFARKAGFQLLGNQRIVSQVAKKSDIEGVLGELDRYRRTRFEWAGAREKEGTVPASVDFATISTSGASALIKKMGELLDVLEDYNRGKAWKDVKASREALKAASKKATSELEKIKGSSEADERAAVSYYRGLLTINQAYAGWTSNPAAQLMSQSIRSINAVTNLIVKSLAQYK